ncbi:MAG: aminotransferase class IV family protein [Chloroflexi bacterium]|nr:aminotransferase class IV family protein [Chloroflexota bacterium]
MEKGPELVMYVEGRLMPQGLAMEIIRAAELQSDRSFYDSERTFNGKVFKLQQHLERLYGSLAYSQISPGVTLEEMESITLQVVEANCRFLGQDDEFIVNQLITLRPPHSLQEEPEVSVIVYCQLLDFSSFAQSYVKGVKLVTADVFDIPTGSWTAHGGQQIIPLRTDTDEYITECVGANFMFVRDGQIKLPSRRNWFRGISAQTVLELAQTLDIPIEEGYYTVQLVYGADEAFITNSRCCLLPVSSLDGFRFSKESPGPETRRLLEAWKTLVASDFVQKALNHVTSGRSDGPFQAS